MEVVPLFCRRRYSGLIFNCMYCIIPKLIYKGGCIYIESGNLRLGGHIRNSKRVMSQILGMYTCFSHLAVSESV